MTRVALDTSVLISAAIASHTHHDRARAALEACLAADDVLVLPGHALVECYSVLTRLPPPERLPAAAALGVIASFVATGEVAALSPTEHIGFIESMARRGIVGGRVYDALVAECARMGNADSILTFNLRHFRDLAPGLEVAEPGP